MSLSALGWDERFAVELASLAAARPDRASPGAARPRAGLVPAHVVGAGLVPARVVGADRGEYDVATGLQELRARVAGRLAHVTSDAADLPVVGDWVAITPRLEEERATIDAVLARRTAVRRRDPGAATRAQVLAANVDLVLVVAPLHRDLAPTQIRIQRYLALARESGADAAVLLTKADLCPDVRAQLERARRAAGEAPVHVTSSVTREGFDGLASVLTPRSTAVLLGPSGAGKSTLVNELRRERLLPTRALDGLGEGRHATVRRELVLLSTGGSIIDTPGLREMELWLDGADVSSEFPDVAAAARGCRFRDCAHADEPGCAVNAAIAGGLLEASRLALQRDLERESARLARARDQRAEAEERRRWRRINRAARRGH